MENLKVQKLNKCLSGEIVIPPDKSISHRCLIFASLLKTKIKIKNISLGQDCISTLKILEQFGITHKFISKRDLILDSSSGFKTDSKKILNCGNSGTTTRLLCGLFSSIENLKCELIGDESLSKRPMKRVIEPLSQMGANIKSNDYKLPIEIEGKNLKGIEHHSLIPSAQVKSALLLAGLNAEGKTRIYEKFLSRNHSEIMLKYLGALIFEGKDKKGFFTEIQKSKLIPKDLEVVGDISSAAFFMVMAAIIPNSEIIIKNVGINPTRTGILDVFKQAQINFELLNQRIICNENTADIKVSYTKNIKPFEIKGDIIPRLIDEIPILAVLATQAQGKSVISDAQDLRNKESDRIKTIVETFEELNINIKEKPDGFEITGKTNIEKRINFKTHLDHRLAMSYFVLAQLNNEPSIIEGFNCVNTSFPEFLDLFNCLLK